MRGASSAPRGPAAAPGERGFLFTAFGCDLVTGTPEAHPQEDIMLEASNVAHQLIVAVRPIVAAVRAHDRTLADQLRRAATSVALNTAEGSERRGGDRVHAFRVARGEAAETTAAIGIAVAWG